jgi:hypothetical protein
MFLLAEDGFHSRHRMNGIGYSACNYDSTVVQHSQNIDSYPNNLLAQNYSARHARIRRSCLCEAISDSREVLQKLLLSPS